MRRDRPANLQTRRGVLKLFACSAGMALIAGKAFGDELYSENAVKAAFLYRFCGYVTWPAQTPQESHFTIALLGADAVAQELERIASGRTIHGLPARVRRIGSIGELGNAQMLFVGLGSVDALQEEIGRIAQRPVLVVTDTPGGLDAGSTLNFLLVDRRVRFEVSLVAANRAGLKISAELLSVAARVEGERLRSDASCAPIGPADMRCRTRFG